MNFPKLMVGISTKQNTINLIPAFQMKVSEFMFVETDFAREERWALNTKDVLNDRGIKKHESVPIPVSENGSLSFISNRIFEVLKDKVAVNFNFGGGQKVQSTALWEVFKIRKNQADVACYADQTNKSIMLWTWVNDSLEQSSINIETDISAIEYFKIHGFKIECEGEYIKNTNVQKSNHDLIEFQEFREYVNRCFKKSTFENQKLYSLEDIKLRFASSSKDVIKNQLEAYSNLVQKSQNEVIINKGNYESQFYECILNIIKTKVLRPDFTQVEVFNVHNPILQEMLGTSKLKVSTLDLVAIIGKSFGQYFEEVVFKRIEHILSFETNNVYDARTNIKISKGDEKGEYDVVLVTKSGTMIVLDAKTDDFDKKDEDARKHNLLSAAGVYADFIPVYLFFPEDIGKPWVNQAIQSKLKDSSINQKKYLTFNSETENKDFEILKQKCRLNPISQLITILKL